MRCAMGGWWQAMAAQIETAPRILDEHLPHFARHMLHERILRNLEQRADQRVGILRQLDTAGIGREFAAARQSETEHKREHVAHEHRHSRDEHEDDHRASPVTARASAAEGRHLHPAPQHLRQERDHAGEDDRDDQQARVAVDDVGQFMGKHRFHFILVQRLEQPARHGDGVALLVDAARIGVHLIGIDDVELRHGKPARDAEIFKRDCKVPAAPHASRAWRRSPCG